MIILHRYVAWSEVNLLSVALKADCIDCWIIFIVITNYRWISTYTFICVQFCSSSLKSYSVYLKMSLPLQVNPSLSSWNPSLHPHSYFPGMFVQSWSQWDTSNLHSSMSEISIVLLDHRNEDKTDKNQTPSVLPGVQCCA